jgi:endoglucanase
MDALARKILREVLSQHTAPFREHHVIRCVSKILGQRGVPHFRDPLGNIIVGAKSEEDLVDTFSSSNSEPLRVFVAHMDHPGLIGIKWTKSRGRTPPLLHARWYGAPPPGIEAGTPVWLADLENTLSCNGSIARIFYRSKSRRIQSAHLELQGDPDLVGSVPATDIFGGLRFAVRVRQSGSLLRARALDNLLGVWAVVLLAIEQFKSAPVGDPPFLGLLTRAEEAGLVGIVGHFETGWPLRAKRSLLYLVLEAVPAISENDMGSGPIVRLGDHLTVFDGKGTTILENLFFGALQCDFKRRVVDTGVCEGTIATMYGFPTISLAVPIGNYHNQRTLSELSYRDSEHLASEAVDLRDLQALIDGCRATLRQKLPWSNPWSREISTFRRHFERMRALLNWPGFPGGSIC